MTMSPQERAKATILIVDSDPNDRNNLRQAFKTLGYGGFSDVPTHAQAVERMQQRPFSHIIFESKKTNMPPKEFLQKILEMDARTVCIPASYEPNVDDVFDLLIMGAKGYLVKPFTADTVEIAMVNATKGEPMASAVLHAKDRNEALVAILMGSVDKAATLIRQSYQFETAKRELPRALAHMRQSAELTRMFSKGGEEGMIEAMEKFCVERSKGPATRLGRLRKRLKTNRVPGEDEEEAESPKPS
jgi:DNA-binding NarL/FixJ family response regulator